MVLGITNYLNEDIENVNIQIEKFIDKIGEENLHIFIFHDNNYEQSYYKYESFKNLTVLTENKNKGTLYGRIQVIKMIPEEFNNEFLIWLDADDEVQNIDKLLKIIDECKDYDWVANSHSVKSLIYKFVKIGVYKKIIEKIKLTPGLRMRTSECNIITAALIDIYNKNEISYKSHNEMYWIKYNGIHQTFNIEDDFSDDRLDNLKADLEDLIQWFIWMEIDKLGFDLNTHECSHFYYENVGKIKNNDKAKNLVIEIIKNMPTDYKEKIYGEFGI